MKSYTTVILLISCLLVISTVIEVDAYHRKFFRFGRSFPLKRQAQDFEDDDFYNSRWRDLLNMGKDERDSDNDKRIQQS